MLRSRGKTRPPSSSTLAWSLNLSCLLVFRGSSFHQSNFHRVLLRHIELNYLVDFWVRQAQSLRLWGLYFSYTSGALDLSVPTLHSFPYEIHTSDTGLVLADDTDLQGFLGSIQWDYWATDTVTYHSSHLLLKWVNTTVCHSSSSTFSSSGRDKHQRDDPILCCFYRSPCLSVWGCPACYYFRVLGTAVSSSTYLSNSRHSCWASCADLDRFSASYTVRGLARYYRSAYAESRDQSRWCWVVDGCSPSFRT